MFKKITDAIDTLRVSIESLVEDVAELAGTSESRLRLKQEIENLKIEKDRLVEDNARRIRETEHKVGLVKTQQEQDLEHAKRMASLEAREGNLTKEREQFQKDMDFRQEHFKSEVSRMESVLAMAMERLPIVKVGHQTTATEAQ